MNVEDWPLPTGWRVWSGDPDDFFAPGMLGPAREGLVARCTSCGQSRANLEMEAAAWRSGPGTCEHDVVAPTQAQVDAANRRRTASRPLVDVRLTTVVG